MVQKGAHLCGFSSETTHQVDQCPTPPRMHFFPVVMGVWWGRDAARRLGPGTHTHSPAPIFPTCNLAPLSALVQMRWSGRWTDAVSKLHIQKTATQRSRNNVSLAWKEHKLVLLFFFSQSKYQYCCFFKSTGARRLLPHNSYSLWAHTSLEWTQGNWAPAGSICQARVSPGKTTYLFPFSFRKIFNYYPIRVKF